ncbi:MAG: sulfite exporter TauE/SafE family protein [Deltaproteobacteria bacterium]|nr:sulfite exporter TauE/SafE family protein [Deltaproteobacteria bacterium]
MDAAEIVMIAGAALAGGAVNAIAGGGSLITFPTLVAAGLSPVLASVTNTVALCPGYLGATLAQRKHLTGQGKRAAMLLPVAALGGVGGALLLLHTDPRTFDVIVPFLILLAAILIGTQERLRAKLLARTAAGRARGEVLAALPLGLAAIYGGYFGAGMGVMILAVLGVMVDDSLLRINALKQTVSLSVNLAAAIVFVIVADVDWTVTAVMAGAALAGGVLGGALSTRIPPAVLRWTVVLIGVAVAAVYFVKLLGR